MGAFNTLRAKADCPNCRAPVDVVVQFKYGDTWQIEYQLGEEIQWGGNDVGDPNARLVAVDGVVEGPCSHCGAEAEWNVYVYIRDDRLERVQTADGSIPFAKIGKTYSVLE